MRIKTLIIGLLCAAILTTPALAEAQGGERVPVRGLDDFFKYLDTGFRNITLKADVLLTKNTTTLLGTPFVEPQNRTLTISYEEYAQLKKEIAALQMGPVGPNSGSSQGATGAAGAQGSQGVQGNPGVPGTNGTNSINVTTVPYDNLTGVPTDFPNSTLPNYLLISTYGSNFPNTSLSNYLLINTYSGDFPNSTLPNYLLISTYGSNFPNNSVTGKLDTATYNGNFPNSTLGGYAGNFPNTSLPNYLLTATYGTNFPNSTIGGYGSNFPNTSLPNYLLTATYGTNFPNSTIGGYAGNFPNTSLPNYLLISTYGSNFPNTSLPNYLLISTYGSNFPNSTSVTANTTANNANTTANAKVSSVTATKPISSSGGTTPNISIARQVPVFQLGNVSTCSRNTAANAMAGLNLNYTTSANTTGTIFATLDFSVASPATISLTSKYQIAYGTGTAPKCNAAATGTTKGQQYTVTTPTAAVYTYPLELTVAISGLAASTQYWIDVQATDSTTGVWIYSLPQLTVIEP